MGRAGTIIISLGLFGFSIKNLSANLKINNIIVQSAYISLTLAIFTLIGMSFKQNWGPKISYYALILLIIRVMLRWCDFEDSRKKFGMQEFYAILVY